jgi:methylmalonyl-CoA/ethylmalonyl-CoA epimerase
MVKIDHIGIAVNSLSSSVSVFSAVLGENPSGHELVPTEGVDVVFFGEGDGRVELLEPTGPDTPIARFLERHGPGLHHVCLSVPDLAATLQRLVAGGISPIPSGRRTGAGRRPVAFIHPKDAGGVLLELVEAADDG